MNQMVFFERTDFFLMKCLNKDDKIHINTEVAREMKLILNALTILGFESVIRPMQGYNGSRKLNGNYKHPIISYYKHSETEWSGNFLSEIGEDLWDTFIKEMNDSTMYNFVLTRDHLSNDKLEPETIQFLEYIDSLKFNETVDELRLLCETNMYWFDENKHNSFTQLFGIKETELSETSNVIEDDLSERIYKDINSKIKKL